MAVWGYCKVCEKLVPIRQGPQKWGSREREWYPYEHEGIDGKRCEGYKKSL